jgi:hypothetical protein
MASTGTAILVSDEPLEGTWRSVAAPTGAAPARQIVAGPRTGQVYVVGWSGLFGSGDWGETWQALGEGLPDPVVTRLLALANGAASRSRLVALAGGALWISENDGSTWQRRDYGLPSQGIDTIVADNAVAGQLWAAGADSLFRSDDNGEQWRSFGNPLMDQHTPIYGIVAAPDGQTVLLTTDRGLYRSPDAGTTWDLLADSVPVHLPARPLLRDLHDGSTVYAGFSIRPYDALWQSAAERTNALQRLDLVNLGGALAFLALVAIAGGFALRRLRRYYAPVPSTVAEAPGAPPARHPSVSSTAAPLSEAGS